MDVRSVTLMFAGLIMGVGRQVRGTDMQHIDAVNPAIASAFSTASGVSIIAINSVWSLRILQTSDCGMAA